MVTILAQPAGPSADFNFETERFEFRRRTFRENLERDLFGVEPNRGTKFNPFAKHLRQQVNPTPEQAIIERERGTPPGFDEVLGSAGRLESDLRDMDDRELLRMGLRVFATSIMSKNELLGRNIFMRRFNGLSRSEKIQSILGHVQMVARTGGV